MTFRVGQKVVCVDASQAVIYRDDITLIPGMDGLKKGRIYTVRQVGLKSWVDGRPTIKLFEIIRSEVDEPYWASRFRPIVERKTDISIFTKMLTPQGVEA